MTVALHDVTVLDFSQGLSGPFCSLLLGDLGARVIKVEPLAGDWARQLEPHSQNWVTLQSSASNSLMPGWWLGPRRPPSPCG